MTQRGIKFRAWNAATGMRSIFSFEQDSNRVSLDGVNFVPVSEVSLLQFTGLHDRNGKEIYEGDIVCSDRYSAPHFEVVFHEGAFRLKDELGRTMVQVTGGTEVIGNIYETPELLK